MCTHPNLMYRVYKDLPWRFHPYDSVFIDELRKKNIEYVLIPCNRCIDCRLDYAKRWSIRLMKEDEMSLNSYFITLTYNNENLPNGLNKKHLQQFFHSLKQHYYRNNQKGNCKIKYFACGEYGENTFRPHYHAIIFNMPLEFEKELSEFFEDGSIQFSKSHKTLYFSKTIKDLWGKGFIQIEKDLSHRAFNYVARYVMKKQYGDKSQIYKDRNILAPFLLCSNGIGKEYFDKVASKRECDQIEYIKNLNEFGVLPSVSISKFPRYYMKLLEKTDKTKFDRFKKEREIYNDLYKNQLARMPYYKQRTYFNGRSVIRKKFDEIFNNRNCND